MYVLNLKLLLSFSGKVAKPVDPLDHYYTPNSFIPFNVTTPMSDMPSHKIYCKAAIFKCSCCGYSTTIYSDVEWVIINKETFCEFGPDYLGENAIQGFIYRDDISINEPLHPQCTETPLSKYNCSSWDTPGLKIHWTEQPVQCIDCKKDYMVFEEYTVGKNMLKFYEMCVESLKLEYVQIEWLFDNGRSYYMLDGPGTKFSAT
jgi:hypothetical protein